MTVLVMEAAAEVPGSVWAIGIAVVTTLVGAVGTAVKLFLDEVKGRRADNDLRREDQKAYTAAILAERAARDAANAPVAEALGKMATAVSEVMAQSKETNTTMREFGVTLKTNTDNTQKMFDRVMEVRKNSAQGMPAVKP